MKNILGNDWVESLLRILSGIIGFIFLIMGIGFLILPEVFAITLFFAETARAVGINSIRGDFSALFLGMSFFCLLGVFSTHRWLLLVPIVFLALVILGRLTSFVADDLPMVMAGTLVSELMFLTVLTLSVISYSFSSRAQKSPPALKTVFNLRFLNRDYRGCRRVHGKSTDWNAVMERARQPVSETEYDRGIAGWTSCRSGRYRFTPAR